MPTERTDRHLVTYVSQEDVLVVLGRLPQDARARLRDVFISDGHHGVKWLGAVTIRGRRDIELYAVLPPRVSFGRYLGNNQRGLQFGAPSRGQWPPWAVRRFLLYDVLLHELGHMQLVLPKSSNWDRKYASEKIAQDFADDWRNKLYAGRFEHPDPIHNKPFMDELDTIRLWERLDKMQRYQLVDLVLRSPHENVPDLTPFGDMNEQQAGFLTRALCPKGKHPGQRRGKSGAEVAPDRAPSLSCKERRLFPPPVADPNTCATTPVSSDLDQRYRCPFFSIQSHPPILGQIRAYPGEDCLEGQRPE